MQSRTNAFPCCYAIPVPIPTCAEDEVGDGRLADAQRTECPWSHRSANAGIKAMVRLLFPGVRWPYAADILRNGTLSVSRSVSSKAQAARSARDQQNSGLIPRRLLCGQPLGLGSPQRHSERQAYRELEIRSIRRQPHAKAQIERPPRRI